MAESQRRNTGPPQLLFDDGSRIMMAETSLSSTSTLRPCSSLEFVSPRGSIPIETYYEVDRLAQEIGHVVHSRSCDDGWSCRVALQFPDELLNDAPDVCWAMEKKLLSLSTGSLPPLVFILGDTTFGPCCPDEVSALHLDADVLVHYGHACLSPALSIPVLYSFGLTDMNVPASVEMILEQTRKEGIQKILLLYEVRYHHAMEELQTLLSEQGDLLVVAGQIPHPTTTLQGSQQPPQSSCCSSEPRHHGDACCRQAHSDTANPTTAVAAIEAETCESKTFIVGGLELPANLDLSSYTLLFVGDPSLDEQAAVVGTSRRQYVNTMLRFLSSPTSSPTRFWTFSPSQQTLETTLPPALKRQLNRRFYLTQKARDASVYGILVGTLSQRHFQSVVASLRQVIHDAGRACYTFAVGKINGAKLANFAEIDCFVLVACGENSLLDNERDLHVPVITPLELDMALGNVEWGSIAYSLDYNDFLARQSQPTNQSLHPHEMNTESDDNDKDAPYFSLVTGTYVTSNKSTSSTTDVDLTTLPGKGQVTAYKSEASEFLKRREYQGLQVNVGQTEVHAAIPGQVGIASNYGERNRNNL